MMKRVATVCNKKGLHARAAAKVVKLAGQYHAHIWVQRQEPPAQGELLDSQDAKVSARSILGLMMLGAQSGVALELTAEGEDSEAALAALVALIEARFDEDE